MVHSGYEATAVTETVRRRWKAAAQALRGIRTEGPMAPDIPLDTSARPNTCSAATSSRRWRGSRRAGSKNSPTEPVGTGWSWRCFVAHSFLRDSRARGNSVWPRRSGGGRCHILLGARRRSNLSPVRMQVGVNHVLPRPVTASAGRCALPDRTRRYIEDIDLPRPGLDAGRAFATRARRDRAHRRRSGARRAGRAWRVHRGGSCGLGPLPCTVPVASVAPMIVPPRPALASGRARHVGDPVAFVVAETRAAARDAAELVRWTGSRCRRSSTRPAALLPGAPQLVGAGAEQPVLSLPEGRPDAVRTAIAGAAHVVELELVNNRIVISRPGATRRDRPPRRRRLPSAVLRRRRARAAVPARGQRVPRAAGADAHRLSRRRRRLRREERALSRVGDAALGGARARPACASG